MRFLSTVLAGILVALAAPAGAQSMPPYPTVLTPPPLPSHAPVAAHSPHPHPSTRATPFMTFSNPAGRGPVNGTACSRTAMSSAQQRTNPITGQPQAATLVSVPITSGGGSVKSATAAQQQADACAHSGR
jgi:hypothetical protein